MKFGFLGTGRAGVAIAYKLVSLDIEVMICSRSEAKFCNEISE